MLRPVGNKAKAKLEWEEVKYEKSSVTIGRERKASAVDDAAQ